MVEVNQEACVGCGACTVVAPDAFKINQEGVSEPTPEISQIEKEVLVRASQACPVSAISVK